MSSNDRKLFSKELHKNIVRNFQRRPALSFKNDDIWSSDLLDMSNLSSHNDNINWLFVLIDNFSRYLWVVPMKDKSASSVLNVFKQLTSEKAPDNLWTDEGKEYYNQQFQDYCDSKDINHYHTYSGLKAVYAERVNRTLREKMNRYMTEHNTERYIDVLPDIVEEYNNTIHTGIHKTPASVYKKESIPEPIEQHIKPKEPKYKVDDFVRIAKVKRTFEKGYTPKWSREVYKIKSIDDKQVPLMYSIVDLQGEDIEGKFYENELQISKLPHYKEYEQVVMTKMEKGVRKYLVHYKEWDPKYDEWIEWSELRKLKPDYKEFEKVVEEKIVDKKKQYLVRWRDEPATKDEWMDSKQLQQAKKKSPFTQRLIG